MSIFPPKDKWCHETAFEKTCFDCVVNKGCAKWVGIKGTNPQTGDPIEHYGCIDGMVHLGMLEMASKINQLGAAIESFRNDTLRINAANIIRETERAIAEVMPKALPVQELKALPDVNS